MSVLSKKPGLAICAASMGVASVKAKQFEAAVSQLGHYFTVYVDPQIFTADSLGYLPVSTRVKSINWAAKQASLVMAWDGGFNAIEVLHRFDELKLTRGNVFIGYSDNTVLLNAFASQKICRAIYGPMLEDMVMRPQQVSVNAQALCNVLGDDILPATAQYINRYTKVLQPGLMQGRIWGGNNYSFDLLQGTAFCPSFTEPFILFMEGEDILRKRNYTWSDFIRNIDSVMLQNGALQNLQGLIIGMFPDTIDITRKDLQRFVDDRPYLSNIPIIYDFPCGHGENSLYLPIGESVKVDTTKSNFIKLNKI